MEILVEFRGPTGLFHCLKCDKGFKQRSNGTSHYKSVHADLKRECRMCGLRVRKLKQHLREVHGERKLVPCLECGKLYREGRLIRDHMTKTHLMDMRGQPLSSVLVTCDICDKEMMASRLERHLRLSHYTAEGHRAACPLCGIQIKFLTWHLRTYHKDVSLSTDLHKCDKCDLWFSTAEERDRHSYCHEPYLCLDCDKTFNTQIALARHMHKLHAMISIDGETFLPVSAYKSNHKDNVRKYLIEDGEIKTDILTNEEAVTTTTIYVDASNSVCVPSEDEEKEINMNNNDTREDITDKLADCLSQDLGDSHFAVIAEGEEGNVSLSSVGESVAVEGGVKLFDIIVPAVAEAGDPQEVQVRVDVQQLTAIQSEQDMFVSERLSVMFTREGASLPRDLRDAPLALGDEALLRLAPPPSDLSPGDLDKYRIQERSVRSKTEKKYKNCPSRQAHLCPYCRSVMKSKANLRNHIASVHTQQKTFLCELCEKTFLTSSDLTKHFRSVHDSSKDDLVECGVCGMKVRRAYLGRHRSYRHSSNALPRDCAKCGKLFKSRETMLKHNRVVHGPGTRLTL